MTHALKNSKREKEINKFRKQRFFKIGAPKNFAIFTGNTYVGASSCSFSKKRLQHKCFLLNIAKNLKVTFFIELLPWSFFFVTI